MYQRKTFDEFDVVALYEHGWEVECTEPTRSEARRTANDYRVNTGRVVKVVRRRVRKEQDNENSNVQK